MRQRLTYIQEPHDVIDPATISVRDGSLVVPKLRATKEERITLGFDELSTEIKHLLQQYHELHVRYNRVSSGKLAVPFISRTSSGLHVYLTPHQNSEHPYVKSIRTDLLSSVLNEVFQSNNRTVCESISKSFTGLPTQRFQHGAALEYFLPCFNIFSPSLHKIFDRFCASNLCTEHFLNAVKADAIDLDFDVISHILTITMLSLKQEWNLDISSQGGRDRIEVGILSQEQAVESGELSFSGFLTTLGEDSKPSPTWFSFPSRHFDHNATFTSSYIHPTGLHPTMQLYISHSQYPAGHDQGSCALHAHLTLPRAIFPDKYQFSDPLFMASKNLSRVRYVSSAVDLEAPEYAVSEWGSSLLLELAPPGESSAPWSAAVPLHLRYAAPRQASYHTIDVPWPVLFWACTAEEGTKFSINPFDRKNLGYDSLFGPRTMFYHLSPVIGDADVADGGFNQITIPVLDIRYKSVVERTTAATVWLGFAWILWKLWLVWRTAGIGPLTKHEPDTKKSQ